MSNVTSDAKSGFWVQVWVWTKRLVIASTAFSVVIVICSVSIKWLERVIDERIDLYFQPQVKYSEAVACFDSERQEEGFRALKETIQLCRKRALPHEREQLESALHSFLYYLAHSKHAQLNEEKLQFVLSVFKDDVVSYTLSDKLNLGWFRFLCCQLELARKEFSTVARQATLESDNDNVVEAYGGLLECALASGDLNEAFDMFHRQAVRVPAYFYAYNRFDPFIKDAEKLYPIRYKKTAMALIEKIRKTNQEISEKNRSAEGK